MIIKKSIPELSKNKIPHFPHDFPFAHQYDFYMHRHNDIILKSPTSSGKTDSFLVSFMNDYINADKRIKCLYLAPTRLLLHSQFENMTGHLSNQGIPHKILESGYSFAELFKHLWENDFIISSPDIIFYLLLRKKRTQHIEALYKEFINRLHSVVFDELHLFDTYILYNINNLIKIIKSIKKEARIYILSATYDIEDIINLPAYSINGTSNTHEISVCVDDISYYNPETVITYLEHNNYLKNTVYVCNSVDRALHLHDHFQGSALLIGKMWYEETDETTREEKIMENLEMCKRGALTFSTSVFQQGIDIPLKRLITEEPSTAQDAIQVFGRCGRHRQSEFIMLSSKSPLQNLLNSQDNVTRNEFESYLMDCFKPREYESLKRMMTAIWYKLYKTTRLQSQVELILTEDMERAYHEFEEFLPDISFREPQPAVKYDDFSINLFEILRYKGAYRFIFPVDELYYVGELRDGGRFIKRQYKKAKKEDLPIFTLKKSKKYKNTEYFNLHLQLHDIHFSVNALVGDATTYLYTFYDSQKLIPIRKSFKPIIFFE